MHGRLPGLVAGWELQCTISEGRRDFNHIHDVLLGNQAHVSLDLVNSNRINSRILKFRQPPVSAGPLPIAERPMLELVEIRSSA